MTHVFDPGSDIWKPSIEYVYMKARRADFHLQSVESQIRDWIKSEPYSMREYDNLDRTKHIWIITPGASPEEIALTVGDFVNCLRSALDQLAWGLINLFHETVPDEKIANQVAFPISRSDEAYRQRRALFHSSIHPALDSLQPKDRGNAIYTHELWQLDKLWNLDKHRTIPVNCGNWTIKFPESIKGWIFDDRQSLEYRIVAAVPCRSRFEIRPLYVKPQVIPEILFGEYMGGFEVSVARMREIHRFVVQGVIPRFAGFFPITVPT